MARLAALVVVICVAFPSLARAAPLHVHWIRGVAAPGTPARYDKVGVIEVGPRSARNVLVLEPGTSAGAAYFVPLARWIAARARGWQVWSVERRETSRCSSGPSAARHRPPSCSTTTWAGSSRAPRAGGTSGSSRTRA